MRKILKRVILLSLFTILLAGNGFAQFKKSKALTLTGSTTVLPVAQACAEEYMKTNKIKITVNGGGSGNGIKAVIDGTAEIGNSSRDAKESEIKMAKEKGVDLYKTVIALDGIAVVVHPDVPVADLKLEQVRDIFAGKINNWKDVGGKDAPIVVVSRDTSSGTYGSFEEMVLHYKEKNSMRADAQMVASNQAVATTVAQTPNSIGYIGVGFLKSAKVKAVTINGVAASEKTVKDKTYPISRTLNMYTNGAPKGDAKRFIDFILSKKGQAVVEEHGFIKL